MWATIFQLQNRQSWRRICQPGKSTKTALFSSFFIFSQVSLNIYLFNWWFLRLNRVIWPIWDWDIFLQSNNTRATLLSVQLTQEIWKRRLVHNVLNYSADFEYVHIICRPASKLISPNSEFTVSSRFQDHCRLFSAFGEVPRRNPYNYATANVDIPSCQVSKENHARYLYAENASRMLSLGIVDTLLRNRWLFHEQTK